MSNLISARVTDEAVAAAKAKIVEINEQLPFLVALSAAQKKRRRVMGQKSVEYDFHVLPFQKKLPRLFQKLLPDLKDYAPRKVLLLVANLL